MKTLILLILMSFVGVGTLVPAQEEEKWQEYRCQHFFIYYKEVPEDFLEEVEKIAEEYYQEITEELGFRRSQSWSWEDRAKIYIYKDQDDYIQSSKQARWSHGAASVRERTIRTFPAAHGFFDSTLPHELGHIIFREFVGFYADVPLWLEEGVAMYQEKAKRWGAHKIVVDAIKAGQYIPLSALTAQRLAPGADEETIALFYAESASLVYYLISELGAYKFVNLCRALKEGDPFEKALAAVYGRFKKIEDLEKDWQEYLKP